MEKRIDACIGRKIQLAHLLVKKSVLLLGPRRTGKSFLIRNQIRPDKYYDLLHADTFQTLSRRPSLIREELVGEKLVAIDEIQKLPILMDEVHAMIEENRSLRFILSGSSARKLKKAHTSLMAGRATPLYLHPFVSAELVDAKKFDLKKILTYGSIPSIYLSDTPGDDLRDYTGLYLKEEIRDEALVRKIENFSRFLHTASYTNGEIVNFEKVAQDAQVPARTIREYYNILSDTLLGHLLEPLNAKGKRKTVSTSKFYFFDIGVANSLTGRKMLAEGTPEYGQAFEHFIFLELKSYIDYYRLDTRINFWRTYSGNEVDFILNEGEIAIEVKSTQLVTEKHLDGLQSFSAENRVKRKIIVSRDGKKRRISDVEIFPFAIFLQALWNGEIVAKD